MCLSLKRGEKGSTPMFAHSGAHLSMKRPAIPVPNNLSRRILIGVLVSYRRIGGCGCGRSSYLGSSPQTWSTTMSTASLN